MPFGAIISDHPDFIGTPEEIASQLMQYIKTPAVIKKNKPTDKVKDESQTIQKILSLVIQYSNVNFRDYKLNTILRRIDKRIKINHLLSVEEYYNFLEKNPEEIRTLFNDLLIGVTEFFRDPEVFKTLQEKIIPRNM